MPQSKSAEPKAKPDVEPAWIRQTRVVHARLPEELRPACEALSRHIRDLHNTSIHLARVALGCFDWDRPAKKSFLKPEKNWPEGGADALAALNAEAAAQNAKRIKKLGAKSKLMKLLDDKNEKPASTILDMTLFESTIRAWPDGLDPQGRPAYARLPSWLAKHCVQNARGSFSLWLAQNKAFFSQAGQAHPQGAAQTRRDEARVRRKRVQRGEALPVDPIKEKEEKKTTTHA